MTVYVVLSFADYEGDYLYGVYSTPETAKQARAAVQAEHSGEEAWIAEVKVDEAPRYRSMLSAQEKADDEREQRS